MRQQIQFLQRQDRAKASQAINECSPRFGGILLVIVIGILSLVAVGCDENARQVNRSELEQLLSGPKGSGSTMWRGTFYCGTAADFHYLRHTIELNRDLLLKINTNELVITPVGKYPLPKVDWVEISPLVLTNRSGK